MTASDTVLPPMRLGEIVLATGRYEVMTAWYTQLLEIEPSLEHAVGADEPLGGPIKPTRMCFFRLHIEPPYQDVVAIFEVPGTRDAPSGDPGLHHMQLRNASLHVLGQRIGACATSVSYPIGRWTTALARACTTAIRTTTRSRSRPVTSRP
jgi:hypothetical protein